MFSLDAERPAEGGRQDVEVLGLGTGDALMEGEGDVFKEGNGELLGDRLGEGRGNN